MSDSAHVVAKEWKGEATAWIDELANANWKPMQPATLHTLACPMHAPGSRPPILGMDSRSDVRCFGMSDELEPML